MESGQDMYFADFIKRRRKVMGMTQAELASLLNVSKSAVAKWECGRGIPDRANFKQLSCVLGVTVEALFSVYTRETDEDSEALIVRELIDVLEAHGYEVKRRTEG